MTRIRTTTIRRFAYTMVALATASGLALAQDAPRGWRRVGDPAPASAPNWQDQDPNSPQQENTAPQENGAPQYDQQQAQNAPPPNYQYQPQGGPPPRLTIKQGTYVTVRINQMLSSDRNQPGDAFAASLARPLVVDGIVVAQTGQMVGGHVVEAQKAGRVTGTSRLKIQLTDLTLVDGQQLPLQSQMVTRNGPTSTGRDAAAIAGTTGLGAAAGAAADWGRGAAIGAGAGAVVGIVGVLLTRGAPTVVYPESVLTFRIEAPVTVVTDRAPQAFRYVEPGDYEQANAQGPPRMRVPGPGAPPPPPYGYPYYGPYPYYGYGYPYYGGNFGVYWGPRFYRGGFYVYRR